MKNNKMEKEKWLIENNFDYISEDMKTYKIYHCDRYVNEIPTNLGIEGIYDECKKYIRDIKINKIIK